MPGSQHEHSDERPTANNLANSRGNIKCRHALVCLIVTGVVFAGVAFVIAKFGHHTEADANQDSPCDPTNSTCTPKTFNFTSRELTKNGFQAVADLDTTDITPGPAYLREMVSGKQKTPATPHL